MARREGEVHTHGRQLGRLGLDNVDGTVQPVVQKEPLSTPGGQIKLWLSDLVPMADLANLPSEFVRPLRDEQVVVSSSDFVAAAPDP